MLKVEKLNEKLLEDVTGGVTACEVAKGIGAVTGSAVIASQLIGVGLLITSAVYKAKSLKERKCGNNDSEYFYNDKADDCLFIGAGFFTLGITSAVFRR